MSTERIQKYLSGLGYGSRREVEEWITDGRLIVNGEAATVGQKISETDAVKFDGKRLSLKAGNEPMRVLLYKKRTGEMVTRDDPEGRRTVFRKLPELETGRWIAVGRLDVNTSGLLLMTNHGELARRLMHPSFEQHREYAVRALGEVSDDAFENLRSSVGLEDGEAHFQTIRFGDNEVDDDEESEGEGGHVKANRWFIVTLAEGRHREVRRLFESQGLTVNRLIRTGYGPIKLGRGIKSGSYREGSPEELRRLLDAVNLDPKEMLPERVRESHRTKSDYSIHSKGEGEGDSAPAAVQKRGDSKTATRAAAALKKTGRRDQDSARWVKASPVERKLVDRAERRSAGDSERTYVAQAPRAAADSPWGKPRVAIASEVPDSDDAPQQHKAKGFGARSERNYSERGDRAPEAPQRIYKPNKSEDSPRAYAPRTERKTFGDKPAYTAERKPYGDKPAYAGARKPYGDKPADRPAYSAERKPYGDKPAYSAERKPYGERPRSSDGDAPRFQPRTDKPSISKPYPKRDGSFKPAFTRDGADKPYARSSERPAFGGAERKPYGDRPRSSEGAAFKPRFKSAEGASARPSFGGERKPYGKPAAAGTGKPTQRFVVKDGAAMRPGKPKLGLGKKKDAAED